jgi:hypothetical protein
VIKVPPMRIETGILPIGKRAGSLISLRSRLRLPTGVTGCRFSPRVGLPSDIRRHMGRVGLSVLIGSRSLEGYPSAILDKRRTTHGFG